MFCIKEHMLTLKPKTSIYYSVIDTWATILNDSEKYKLDDSPLRLFCTVGDLVINNLHTALVFLINIFLFHNLIHQNLFSLSQTDFQHWSNKKSLRNFSFILHGNGQDFSDFLHPKSRRHRYGKFHYLTYFHLLLTICQMSCTKISTSIITGVLSY